MGTYRCENCSSHFKLGIFMEMGGDSIDKSLCKSCISEIDRIRGFLTPNFTQSRRENYFCRTCKKIRRQNISSSNPERNNSYCVCLNSSPSVSSNESSGLGIRRFYPQDEGCDGHHYPGDDGC